MKNFRLNSIALVLMLVLANVSLRGGVLMGPVVNPANGHSYYLLTSNTWTASEAEAITLRGHLVTIDDAAENNWVFDTFSGGQRNLWIGLNDRDTNGVYTWASGTAASYFNWDTGPSTQPDGNDLLVFMARSDLGHGLTARKWHDVGDNPIAQFDWIGPVFGVVESLVPSVSIAVSKVKVTQNVVVGRYYLLESSTNLTSWEAVVPPFTAVSETIVNEFDVGVSGRFFRLRDVPEP